MRGYSALVAMLVGMLILMLIGILMGMLMGMLMCTITLNYRLYRQDGSRYLPHHLQ